MIRDGGDDRIEITGAMTLATARALLSAGSEKLHAGTTLFDLGSVQEVDSSGLTVIFGWQRAAARAGKTIRIINPPQNLLTLAELYGVEELLPF